MDTARELADELALIGEFAKALEQYIFVVKHFEQKYGLKDSATQAHAKALFKIVLDGKRAGTLTLTQEQGAYLEKMGLDVIDAQSTAAAESEKKVICDALPGNASAVLAVAGSAVRTGQTPAGTVQRWESACNRIRNMLDVAAANHCSTSVRNDIKRAGNAAYSNGKTYADAWKREYLEDLHMGCYSMPVY